MDQPKVLPNFDKSEDQDCNNITFAPAKILGPDGPIAKNFPNYESRPPQIQMAEAVFENMKQSNHFFCEAGTGTGKSYAFLIPAIELALKGGGPIVISTNTISLQEQIFRKDIPDLKKYLNVPHLKVVLRKGRGNYLSKRRHQNSHNYPWTTDQITEIEDIDTWSDKSLTGTVQDLDFIPSKEVWGEVRSDQYDCLGKKCGFFNSCFYQKSKEDAAKAHIVITNHALLTLDLMLKYKTDDNVTILPKFKYLVVDEAHALEDAIRKADTFEWKQGSALHLVKRAANKKDKGFLDTVLKIQGVPSKSVTHAREAIKYFKNFVEINSSFFDRDVIPFVKKNSRYAIKSPTAKRVKPGNLTSKTSEKLISTLHSANKYLGAVVSELKRISDDECPSKSIKDMSSLLDNYWGRTKEVESELKRAIEGCKAPDDAFPTHVSSVEASPMNGKMYYTVVSAPIFVRQIAQKVLFGRIPSVLLTSATLTTGNRFEMIARTLGAPTGTKTLQLPHLFDYKKQVRIILTPKMPLDPWNKPKDRDKYFDTIARKIEKYVLLTKGNAFVLCTSNKQMHALHQRSRDLFQKKGLYVLKQGDGLTREQIVEEFKTVKNSVLFAVDSFWTGVDIPGDHLQNIIIPKLPFPPPTPLSEAQQEMYDQWNKGKTRFKKRNYFVDRTVPSVAIKLQQGFGRLIRHKTDKGIVVLMDPRMISKPYGKTLLASLPPCDKLVDGD
jgi:ATP-dependent DNA helicase DinG